MALTSAMEDYLEAVLMMQKRHGYLLGEISKLICL